MKRTKIKKVVAQESPDSHTVDVTATAIVALEKCNTHHHKRKFNRIELNNMCVTE